MAVSYNQVSCDTNATQIVPAGNTGSFLSASMLGTKTRRVTLVNTSSTTVYIGDASVASGTGFALIQNAQVVVDLLPSDALYGRTATSTATVAYIVSG